MTENRDLRRKTGMLAIGLALVLVSGLFPGATAYTQSGAFNSESKYFTGQRAASFTFVERAPSLIYDPAAGTGLTPNGFGYVVDLKAYEWASSCSWWAGCVRWRAAPHYYIVEVWARDFTNPTTDPNQGVGLLWLDKWYTPKTLAYGKTISWSYNVGGEVGGIGVSVQATVSQTDMISDKQWVNTHHPDSGWTRLGFQEVDFAETTSTGFPAYIPTLQGWSQVMTEGAFRLVIKGSEGWKINDHHVQLGIKAYASWRYCQWMTTYWDCNFGGYQSELISFNLGDNAPYTDNILHVKQGSSTQIGP